MGQRLAQALAGFGLRAVGPKQTGQGIAPVGTVGLDSQIGQEGAGLVCAKAGQGPAIQGYLKRTQQRNRQMFHARFVESEGAGVRAARFVLIIQQMWPRGKQRSCCQESIGDGPDAGHSGRFHGPLTIA